MIVFDDIIFCVQIVELDSKMNFSEVRKRDDNIVLSDPQGRVASKSAAKKSPTEPESSRSGGCC
jgi:hypothetical protein